MGFRRKIKYYLVHQLGISNDQADRLIRDGAISVDQKIIDSNIALRGNEQIQVNGQVIKEKKTDIFILFHKPKGYISSLNPKVKKNISVFFSNVHGLAIAGRLDKDSEGLLVITNNGKWINKATSPLSKKEKEYLVETDRDIDEDFIRRMSAGMELKEFTTQPCLCVPLGKRILSITITEGKNRQIRRMCRQLDYEVTVLKRRRFDVFYLNDIQPGKWIFAKF